MHERKEFWCLYCDASFDTVRQLNGHRAVHGERGRKQCDGTWQDYMRHKKHKETACTESKIAWRIEGKARERRATLRNRDENQAKKELL